MTGHTKKGKTELLRILERRILSGELSEGERLPAERALADEAGISRPLVREILGHLAERNLVEILPGSGAYVLESSPRDTVRSMGVFLRRSGVTPRSLVEARGMIESEAAALACARATTSDIDLMRRALEKFEAAPDVIERARYDLVFHSAMVRAAHNPVLETMFSAISESVAEMMIRSLGDPIVSRVGIPYHDEIFKSVERGDELSASVSVREHLKVAERLYGEDYDLKLEILAERELTRFLDVDADLATLKRESEEQTAVEEE